MIITANGAFKLKTTGKASAVYVDGDLGGGTATVGMQTSSGYVPYKDDAGSDVVLDIGQQYEVRHGQNKDVYIDLTSSSNASLNVSAYGLQ